MRSTNIIFSTVHLFVVFFVLSLGALFIGTAFSETFRVLLADLLYENPRFFFLVGLCTLFIGTIFLIVFYWFNQRRYIQISMDCTKTRIDESIIQEYVEKFWKTQFANSSEILDVAVKPDQKLEVLVAFNKQPVDEQLLERIQSELGVLLARRLGYEKDFMLTILQN